MKSKKENKLNEVFIDKGYVGFSKEDIPKSSENNNFDLFCKNGIFAQKNVTIGKKTNNNIKDDIVLSANGNIEINGDCYIEKDLFIKSNAFFNNSLLMNNSISLDSENLDKLEYIDLNISIDSYKSLLSNIINTTINNNLNDDVSSIKFYSDKTKFIAPSIVSINKKFKYKDNIIMSFGLFYVIFLKKKILSVKPILDTFTLIDKSYNLIKINNEINYSKIEHSQNVVIDKSKLDTIIKISDKKNKSSKKTHDKASDKYSNLASESENTSNKDSESKSEEIIVKPNNTKQNVSNLLANIFSKNLDDESINNLIKNFTSNIFEE